jgi:hypothetical protein
MTRNHTSARKALRLGLATAVAAVGLVAASPAQAYSYPGFTPPGPGKGTLPYPGMPKPTGISLPVAPGIGNKVPGPPASPSVQAEAEALFSAEPFPAHGLTPPPPTVG